MIITKQILEQYNAPQAYVAWFEQQFPSGEAEFIDIARDVSVDLDFLHFIKKYINLDGQDLFEYNTKCKIEDSDVCWYSKNVYNSDTIIHSDEVINSDHVFHSSNVSDSVFIYNSRVIQSCTNIAYSGSIQCSSIILQSSNVNDSNYVAGSTLVSWSDVVAQSTNVRDSSYVYCADNVLDCHMCGFVENSRHCLFCFNISGKEYCVFNKKVDPMIYENIRTELMAQLSGEMPEFIKVTDAQIYPENRFRYRRRFDSIFDGLSPDFYGWVGTIPGYSEDTFFDLFFKVKNL